MFARVFTANLKPGQGTGFTTAIDHQAIPIMAACSGFRDELVLISTDGKQAVGISFWDHPEHAEAYRRDGYARVLDALAPFIEGTPAVFTYDVTVSTAHHIMAHMTTA